VPIPSSIPAMKPGLPSQRQELPLVGLRRAGLGHEQPVADGCFRGGWHLRSSAGRLIVALPLLSIGVDVVQRSRLINLPVVPAKLSVHQHHGLIPTEVQ